MDPLKMLQNRGVSQELIDGVAEFRRKFGETPVDSRQVVVPSTLFYGKEILEMAIAALLQGENILLSGSKATERMSLRTISAGFSIVPPTISPSMSIRTALPSLARILLRVTGYFSARGPFISAQRTAFSAF